MNNPRLNDHGSDAILNAQATASLELQLAIADQLRTRTCSASSLIDFKGGRALEFPIEMKSLNMKSRAIPPRSTKLSDDILFESLKLPPLVMVRAFEAAARTGSMRKAADDIGVTHTVISRHVRNLESWAGRKLLETGPWGSTLTQEGAIFHRAVFEAFQIIAAAAVELRPRSRKGMLRI